MGRFAPRRCGATRPVGVAVTPHLVRNRAPPRAPHLHNGHRVRRAEQDLLRQPLFGGADDDVRGALVPVLTGTDPHASRRLQQRLTRRRVERREHHDKRPPVRAGAKACERRRGVQRQWPRRKGSGRREAASPPAHRYDTFSGTISILPRSRTEISFPLSASSAPSTHSGARAVELGGSQTPSPNHGSSP